jgi:hypothetical protein
MLNSLTGGVEYSTHNPAIGEIANSKTHGEHKILY